MNEVHIVIIILKLTKKPVYKCLRPVVNNSNYEQISDLQNDPTRAIRGENRI